MTKKRFKIARFIVSMDLDSMDMVTEVSKKFTRGNSSEAIRFLIAKGYEALNPPREPEKSPEPAASQVFLL